MVRISCECGREDCNRIHSFHILWASNDEIWVYEDGDYNAWVGIGGNMMAQISDAVHNIYKDSYY